MSRMSGGRRRRSRQHRRQLGLQAVDLQRLLHPLRTQGPGADPGAGLGVLSPDRPPLPGRAGAGARRPRVGPQGERQGPRQGRATSSPAGSSSARPAIRPGRSTPSPSCGRSPSGPRPRTTSGSSRTRSIAGSTTARARAVAARPARRAARAHRGHLRRQQGVRDDRLADRRGAGAAASDQGDGGAPVAHHHRAPTSRPCGRPPRPSPTRRSTQEVTRMVARVPPPPRLPGASGSAREAPGDRVRRAARRVLLLLPGGRHPGAGSRDRRARSASS